eukprot:TRINITY_DN4565_c0_g1_i2.p1 TRINITY_DN4565_c0_g1~~TRINITY_DN4565_c0_g1_i2.p1  ORF type:complete len:597 (+),score=72.23 TRINITY_DN4565_c0_g1_i2:50-1840(+)
MWAGRIRRLAGMLRRSAEARQYSQARERPLEALPDRRLEQAAAKRGGRYLGHHPESGEPHWQCAAGHRWEEAYSTISRKRYAAWCPSCNAAEAVQVARLRGGECLSPVAAQRTQKLRWRCAAGHEWEARMAAVVQDGQWCMRCFREAWARRRAAGELAGAPERLRGVRDSRKRRAEAAEKPAKKPRKVAAARARAQPGSEQAALSSLDAVSTAAVSSGSVSAPRAQPATIPQPDCAPAPAAAPERRQPPAADVVAAGTAPPPPFPLRLLPPPPRPPPPRPPPLPAARLLRRASEAAEMRGGSCETEVATVTADRPVLQWRCAEGHRWRAPLPQRPDRWEWCPRCRATAALHGPRQRRHAALRLAAERGGACTTEEQGFFPVGAKLRWRCAEGHEFEATQRTAARRWCRQCAPPAARGRRKLAPPDGRSEALFAEAAALAERLGLHFRAGTAADYAPRGARGRNGVVKGDAALPWRCASGHYFAMPLDELRERGECPVCRRWADRVQCLSEMRPSFADPDPLMKWRCQEGHVFERRYLSVRKCIEGDGEVCPICYKPPGKRRAAPAAPPTPEEEGIPERPMPELTLWLRPPPRKAGV